MVEIAIWKFVVCIVAVGVVFWLMGYQIGKDRGTKPVAGGIIDIEPGNEGGKRCTFKLEGDIDWIEKQNFIVFEVRRQSQNSQPV